MLGGWYNAHFDDLDKSRLQAKAARLGLVLSTHSLLSGELQLLDNADLELAAQDLLLVKAQGKLLLLSCQPDGHHPLICQAPTQAIFYPAKLQSQLTPSPLPAALSPLRSLQTLARVTGKLEQWLLQDDWQKTCGSLMILHLDLPEPLMFVQVMPCRGFSRCETLLEQWVLGQFSETTASKAFSLASHCSEHPLVTARSALAIPTNQTDLGALAKSWLAASVNMAFANIQGIQQDRDTEYLHQFRVNLRKSRSVLSLLKGGFAGPQQKALAAQLRTLMNRTNELRDLDVHLLAEDQYRENLPDNIKPQADKLVQRLRSKRQRAYRHLSSMLASKAFQRQTRQIQQDIADLPSGPKAHKAALEFGRKKLLKQVQRIIQLAQQLSFDPSDQQIHNLRLACKKARYLAEFFLPGLTGKTILHLAKTLKKLTTLLGDFNDQCVQQQELNSWLLQEQQQVPSDHSYIAYLQLLCQHCEDKKQQARNKIIRQLLKQLTAASQQQLLNALRKTI